MLSLFEKIVNDNPKSIVKPQNMFTIDTSSNIEHAISDTCKW